MNARRMCSRVNHSLSNVNISVELFKCHMNVSQKVLLNISQRHRIEIQYLPQNAAGENFRLT